MPTSNGADRNQAQADIPLGIYASMVDALFAVPNVLFIGSVAGSLAALITAWKASDAWLLGFGVTIALVATARVLDMRMYARIRPTLLKASDFQKWERRYVIGAAVFVALLGGWTLAAFVRTDDAFVRLFSFSFVLAYMSGASGRNFASDLLVKSQILCAGVPLSGALFVAGGYYFAILGLVILPFFIALKLMSDRLRATLLNAVIATRDITKLANQFDTALNNLPQGLCMFDGGQRLVVANRHVPDLLELPEGTLLLGATARELLVAPARAGRASAAEFERFINEFEASLCEGGGNLYFELRDGKTIALTIQPMAAGGSVVVIEDITERRAAEARINHLARYDALTGLPNRTYFHDELNRVLATMRRSGPSAVLFIDLDQFKQVNDTLGHPNGDALLCAVADRLRQLQRSSDVVARFGGDEFVFLMSSVSSSTEAADLAALIVTSLSAPYEVDSHQVVIGASVGIAMAPRDGVDADLLLRNADMALYQAKIGGRCTWRFFEPVMDVEARARRAVELDLRDALANGDFELYFQPLFELKTMRIATCEALIRWHHPERGTIGPNDFIPVAEDMGLIVAIGAWVIHQACIECTKWPADVRVAVNLSPVQFRRSDIVRTVVSALHESGLAANRLEIEVTESALLGDIKMASKTLRSLRDMGVRISLDDFGTGYSGLSYLGTFPLDKVKIDRSFVRHLKAGDRSLTLLRGVAQLSAALGMAVAVEGVETEEQLALIAAESSIHEAQGFLFSIPIPSRQIAELLSTAHRRRLETAYSTEELRAINRA